MHTLTLTSASAALLDVGLDINTAPFRFVPYLILPVLAIAIIAFGVYLVRHRGKNRAE